MVADDLSFSREDLLEGFPARRASMLLYAIESRTAALLMQSRQITRPLFIPPDAAVERENDFFDALSAGRDAIIAPNIQQIERFAPHWANLLPPEDPQVRAAIADLLGQKYRLTRQVVPQIRLTLALDTDAVQQAYQRQFNKPLTTIYVPTVSPRERLRWASRAFSDRLEALPPFWTTFFLNMPGAGGLLALPIALASVGLGLGLAIVILFGVVNMLTVAALAETVVRSGTSRFGLGFLGQLAQEYLGSEATILLTITFAINNFFILVIFFLGVSGTLAGTTNIVATLWMLPQFAITVYFLSRRSLNATITATMLIALVSLGLVITIPLLALPNLRPGNLDFAPKAFGPATLGLVVGVMSTTFLSHFLVATYGPVVLPRDPSGRSWVRGSMAAIGVFMAIACLWLVITSGVLSPETLLKTTGTIISPLAERVGPIINILGTLLVILSLGLATIQVSLAQYFSVEERLPPRGSATWVGKLSESRRLFVAISPMFGVLIVAEWLSVSGIGSFATLLGVFDVLVLPLLAGIIPVLLLAATRRKGDYSPGFTVRFLGHPTVLGLLYVFFVSSIVVHGLFIWEAWPLRLFALGSTIAILIVTGMIWRRGLWDGRVVLELRHDQRLNGISQFSVVGNGGPLLAAVKLIYREREREHNSPSEPIEDFDALEAAVFQLPPNPATQLKLWLHHLPAEGGSKSLPAHITIEENTERRDFNVNNADGPLFIMKPTFPCSITITLIKD